MSLRAIDFRNEFLNSPMELTKDKVIALRIEPGMYKLLEELSQDLSAGSVSQVTRDILRFYLLNAIYEKEWKRIHSKDFQSFVEQIETAGNTIELENYRELLAEVSRYLKLLKEILKKTKNSVLFFDDVISELEEVTEKLEKVNIIFERKK